MAEYVEQSIEEMLGELERMTSLGIFTASEQSIIVKNRKKYEYKLRRQTKAKEDYLHYIQYEVNVLALIDERLEEMGGNESQVLFIQRSIVERICKLFWLATTRFKNDEALWLSYIQFVKQRGHSKAQVSRIFTDMLKVLNQFPKLWVMAAGWEFESCCNHSSARTIMQKGLRFNDNSKLLWLEYYKLELMIADKIRDLQKSHPNESHDDLEAVSQGKVAGVVLDQAIKAFPGDIPFTKQLLEVCNMFDFTDLQERTVLEGLRENYSDHPEAWDVIARHSISTSQSYDIYREAVTKFPSETMWTLYLDFCMENHRSMKEDDEEKSMLTERVLSLFNEAAVTGCLSQHLYQTQIELLIDTHQMDLALTVSAQGIQAYPGNASLQEQHLKLLCNQGASEIIILKAFKQAQKTVAVKESSSLWKVILDHLLCINSTQLIPLLEEGSRNPIHDVCFVAKEWYLSWYSRSHSPTECWQLYKRLTQISATSLKFYYAFVAHELKKPNFKLTRIRQVFEDAIRDHGITSVDVWLYYIACELCFGDPLCAGKVHDRAIKALDASHVDDFITQYTILKNSADGFRKLMHQFTSFTD